jgi:hypothetical protein
MQNNFYNRIHPKEQIVLGTAGLLLTVPVLALSFAFSDPIIEGDFKLFPCFHKAIFHKECYTCGMTRSFGAMWKGNIRLAKAYNRGGPAAFIMVWILFFMSVFFISCNIRLRFRRSKL